jgi:hypothetical protein
MLTVSEESVGVRVLEGLVSGQRGRGGEAIAQVVSSRAEDTIGMGHLMESGSGLILSMALLGEIWQIGEVQWAVDDEVLGR